MREEGLTIRSPFSYFEALPPSEDVIAVLFFIVFFIWAIYSIVAAYHWIRYGRDSWIAVPALLIHVLVSGALMIFAVSGLR